MATSFTPKFADLVRVMCATVGTGNLVPGATVLGFTSFSAALSVGDRFYYSVAGVDKPGESEVGRGTLTADGSIAREAIGGTLTNFTSGQKTVSLVVGAEWFRTAASGGGGSAAPVAPLFSEIWASRFTTGARRIDTAGRTSVGGASARRVSGIGCGSKGRRAQRNGPSRRQRSMSSPEILRRSGVAARSSG